MTETISPLVLVINSASWILPLQDLVVLRQAESHIYQLLLYKHCFQSYLRLVNKDAYILSLGKRGRQGVMAIPGCQLDYIWN